MHTVTVLKSRISQNTAATGHGLAGLFHSGGSAEDGWVVMGEAGGPDQLSRDDQMVREALNHGVVGSIERRTM